MIKKLKCKRVFSLFLSFVMLLGLFPVTVMADNVQVKIVSFMRGEQADLRASELLEAEVTGYSGNVQDLTYEWSIDNNLGTYLYVYNSHNMYNIMNTSGEIEIYNNKVSASSGMSGRTYKNTFAGKGYVWAALYDANASNDDLVGTVTVKVKDAQGNVLATDSHTGTKSGKGDKATYRGFVSSNLNSDLQQVSIGMFAGETREVRSLLGESSIVHIDCTASSASGVILTQYSPVSVRMNNNKTNLIAASAGNRQSGGDAVVEVTVSKQNCKFHQYDSGKASVYVYVYKKPETSSTTTTITLDKNSLDTRCRYFIQGQEGVKQTDGSVLFTGLTPNTRYEIEVVGQTSDAKPVYAYVYETTKVAYSATVNVKLNRYGQANAENADLHTLLGKPEADVKLALKQKNGDDVYALTKDATGVYKVTDLDNGTYVPQYSLDGGANWYTDTQEMVIHNQNSELTLNFFAVEYYVDNTPVKTEYYHWDQEVHITDYTPVKEDYDFVNWDDRGSDNTYEKGNLLVANIQKAYRLDATWTEAKRATAYVTVEIDHTTANGQDPHPNQSNLEIALTYKKSTDPVYVATNRSVILQPSEWYDGDNDDVPTWDAKTTVSHVNNNKLIFTDLSADWMYAANASMLHYAVTDMNVVTEDMDTSNPKYYITLKLKYDPNLFNLEYKIVADNTVPDDLIPRAADLKVLQWDSSTNTWDPISRHQTTTDEVLIDEKDGNGTTAQTGEVARWGTGSYNVPAEKNASERYYYRVSVAGVTLDMGGKLVELNAAGTDGVNYTSSAYSDGTVAFANGAYTAKVELSNEAATQIAGTTLKGAWGTGETSYAQKGEILVTISMNLYDVIFENDGVEINRITDQYMMPDIRGQQYIPTKEGYTFDGWYVKDTDTKAETLIGDGLSSDVTLEARWKVNRKIEVNVAVSGVYNDNGALNIIHESDLAKEVHVIIQRNDDGYLAMIDDDHVEISYGARPSSVSSIYGFVGNGQKQVFEVPNDGKEYWVTVVALNYETTYQYEPKSVTEPHNYNGYGTQGSVVFAGGENYDDENTGVVNAFMGFEPENFDLKYQIDATDIGAGFRPKAVEMLVVYDDGATTDMNTEHWPAITQMLADGKDTTLTNGVGNDSYAVWNRKTDGETLYEYGIKLNEYVAYDASGETVFDNNAPFRVGYNGSTRYVENASGDLKQTKLLIAKLEPKDYTIFFDLNMDVAHENVTGMDGYYNSYGPLEGKYTEGYTWSYGKDISGIIPGIAGYTFLGWFADKDCTVPVTAIEAASHEDITVYAKWNNMYSITVETENCTSDPAVTAENNKISVAEGGSQTISFTPATGYTIDTVTVDGNSAVLTYNGTTAKYEYTFSNVTQNHTIKVVCAPDEHSEGEVGDTETGDGIPDKYQALVTYKIEYGTWDGQSNADKKYYFTLKAKDANGVWQNVTTVPTLNGTIPVVVNAKADSNHVTASGHWLTPVPVAGTEVTANAVYTYSFKEPIAFTFDANGGAWAQNINEYVVTTDGTVKASKSDYFDGATVIKVADPTRQNYEFAGWYTNKDGTGTQWWASDTSTETITTTTTVYAKWIGVDAQYTVQYVDYDTKNDSTPKVLYSNVVNNKKYGETATVTADLKYGDLYTLCDVNGTLADNTVFETFTVGEVDVITFYYTQTQGEYTVEYYRDGEGVPFQKTEGIIANLGTKIESVTIPTVSGYALDRIENLGLVVDNTPADNVIKVYFAPDNWDDADDNTTDGDNIPDKYQAVVTYKVVNGTWNETVTTEKVAVFTLKVKENGVWNSVAPTLADTIPTAKPNDEFKASDGSTSGYWDVTPDASTVVIANAVYTYTFREPVTFTFHANGGAWDINAKNIDKYNVDTTDSAKIKANKIYFVGDEVINVAEPKRDNYEFVGWYMMNGETLTDKPWNAAGYKVTSNTHVGAKWVGVSAHYGVQYKEIGTDVILAYDVIENVEYGLEVKVEPTRTFNLYELCDDKGNVVTNDIKMITVGTDHIVTFYYKQTQGEYSIKYYYDEQDHSTKKGLKANLDDTIDTNKIAAYLAPENDSYTLDRIEGLGLKIDKTPDDNVIKVYFATDVWDYVDNNTTDGDDIPDKYQALVRYKIDHGTWDAAGADKADKVHIFTLKTGTAGAWTDVSPVPTLDGTIPEVRDAKPETNYSKASGKWDETPDGDDYVVPGETTYTYSFMPALTFTFDANGGAWDVADGVTEIDGYAVTRENGKAVTASKNDYYDGAKVEEIKKDPDRDNYEFAGWYTDINDADTQWWADGTSTETIKNTTTVFAKWNPMNNGQYVVKYLEEGTNVELRDSETVTGLTYASNQPVTVPVIDLYELTNCTVNGTAESVSGNAVTITVGTDHEIIFYYTQKQGKYRIEYYYDDSHDSTKEDLKADLNDTIDEIADKNLVPKSDDFTLDRIEGLGLVIDKTPADNVIKVYFAKDVWDDADDNTTDGDDIPDKYQAVVTYKVVNGTWVETASTEKVAVFTLKYKGTDGAWKPVSPAPTLNGTIPAPTPNSGYTTSGGASSGYWEDNNEPTDATEVVKTTEYTYIFRKPVTFTFHANGGAWANGATSIGEYAVTTDGTQAKADKTYFAGDEVIKISESPVYANYDFKGWYMMDNGSLTAIPWDAEGYVITENTDVGAKWTAKEGYGYTVRYIVVDANGTEIDVLEEYTDTTTYGATVTKTADLIRDKHYELLVDKTPAEQSITIYEPDAAKNVITFKYIQTMADYSVEYYYEDDQGNYDLDNGATKIFKNVELGGLITAVRYSDRLITGYCLDVIENLPLTIGANSEQNVVRVYFAKDELNGYDNIPDKYQALVTYKVENGAWDTSGDNSDVEVVFTLKEKNNGVWEDIVPAPTLGNTIPDVRYAEPEQGYMEPGYWSPIPNAKDKAVDGAVYTYTFTQKTGIQTFTFNANGGAWENDVYGYNMDASGTIASKEYYMLETVEKIDTEPVREGYTFLGWYSKNDANELTAKWWHNKDEEVCMADRDVTVYAKWEKTDISEKDGLKGYLWIMMQDENGAYLGGTDEAIEVYDGYKIATEADTDVDFVIPAEVSEYEKDYVYDKVVTGDLEGAVSYDGENIIVILQYKEKANSGDDTPEGTPDRVSLWIYLQDEDENVLKLEKLTIYDDAYVIDHEDNMVYDAEYTIRNTIVVDNINYMYDGVVEGSLTGTVTDKDTKFVVRLQYTVDEWDDKDSNDDPYDDDDSDKPSGSDGIPDKYQSMVIYEIKGGTWDGEDDDDKVEIFTLKEKDSNGDWVDRAYNWKETIPDTDDAEPKAGYVEEGAAWKVDPNNADDSLTEGKTIVYTYLFKGDSDEEESEEPSTITFTFDANGGEWEDEVFGYTMDSDLETAKLTDLEYGDEVEEIPEEPVRDGYTFEGWYSRNTSGKLTVEWWESNGEKEYVYEDETVYAKWKAVKEEAEPFSGTLVISLQDEYGMSLDDLIKKTIIDTYEIVYEDDDYNRHEVNYVIKDRIRVDGKEYIFDRVLEGDLSGKLSYDGERVLVILQYEKVRSGGGNNRPSKPTEPSKPVGPSKVDEVLNTKDHFQYVQGYPEGTVGPERNITRAEATVIFFRLLQDHVRADLLTVENNFPDVNLKDWFNAGISTMESGGFVSGYDDGYFRPNGYITRAELATIISNFDDLEPVEGNKFPDVKGHWAEKYVNSAAAKGWLSGYDDGLFRPNQYITRAETMSMINRVLGRKVNAAGLHRDAKQWIDNTEDKWYYYAVLEATNHHDYERADENSYENWTAINKNKVWEN